MLRSKTVPRKDYILNAHAINPMLANGALRYPVQSTDSLRVNSCLNIVEPAKVKRYGNYFRLA